MAAQLKVLASATFFILVLCGLFWLAEASTRQAAAFFSQILSAHGVEERIVIHGKSYRVASGRVTLEPGGQADATQTLQALRIAYLVTTAKHAPLFGMAGSDPEKIEAFAVELEAVAEALGTLQDTPAQKKAVAEALYPTSFLASLAQTERIRREFIQEPSDMLSTRYVLALGETLRRYERDLHTFLNAFEQEVDETMSYRVLGGLITKESFLKAGRDAQRQVALAQKAHRERQLCLTGATQYCSAGDLLPATLPPRPLQTKLRPDSSLLEEVLAIYRSADPAPAPFEGSIIASNTSGCVPSSSFLQYRLFKTGRAPESFVVGGSLRFLNDIYSYKTPRLADLAGGEAVSPRDPGVLFALYQPTAFYQCPELGADIAAARATEAAYAALLLPAAETLGGYPVLKEETAYREVQAALAAPVSAASTGKERAEILEVARMFLDHSGRFEDILEEIVFNQHSSIKQHEAGLSPDIDANWQFAVKSGFGSLFLLHHKTMGDSFISVFAERQTQPESADFLAWSQLRHLIPLAAITEDLRTFLLMHLEPKSSRSR